jgi:hypothetical protein
MTAHEVNVGGTLNLLEFAQHEAESHGRPVVFLYPSSIAAYGLPAPKRSARRPRPRRRVDQPTTMYGCNKLYCEQLGEYYASTTSSSRPSRSPAASISAACDFRADFRGDGAVGRHLGLRAGDAPRRGEGEPYACFVRPDTRIPFMAMPDGVDALLALAPAPRAR